jgi:hypothetical protein
MGGWWKKIHFRKESTWDRIAPVSEIHEEVSEAMLALGTLLLLRRLP